MAVPYSQKLSIPTITELNRDAKLGVASGDRPLADNDNFAQRQVLYAGRDCELILVALHRRLENIYPQSVEAVEIRALIDRLSNPVANENANTASSLAVAQVISDNERPFPHYLLERAAHHRVPGLVYVFKKMRPEIAELGGSGVLVPDALRPYHITCNDLYFGACTPKAIERPHWHFKGWESYTILEGEASMLVKFHEAMEWETRVLHPHDTILVAPGVCHWLRWNTEDGYAIIHKAPTIPGIGLPPNGKQTCQTCHLYNNGCILPDGFNPD
jgi:hypothetical protein